MIKNYIFKIFAPVLLLFVLLLFGCSNDDNDIPTLESFYKGAIISAKAEDLIGIWAIYEVEYEGKKTQVPESYKGCGRDFFIFMKNGMYKEYAAYSSECYYDINEINWSLNEGIVYVGPSVPQSDEMILVGLSKDKLVFRVKMDIDEDGIPDILTFTTRRYTPPNDPDIYTPSFQWDDSPEHSDKIQLKWMAYQGFNDFDRYEVYRSTGEYNKNNAELVGTITDKYQDFFVDEDPPAFEKVYYFFRLYTDKGLVGESIVINVYTDYLEITPVKLSTPTIINDAIELDWETYNGYYFSHYEITVGTSVEGGSPGEEVVITKIEDINTTTFVDNALPYIIDPVYSVYVYNIFGQKNRITQGVNYQKATYAKPGVLPFKSISFIETDKEESVVYLFTQGNLYRYNYGTQTMEAKAKVPPTSDTTVRMKVVQSADYGKEVIFHQFSGFNVYDANTLEFKYKLHTEAHLFFYHYTYLHNNLWMLADGTHVYTYKRDGDILRAVDRAAHLIPHQGDINYYPIPISDNQVIVGHHNVQQSTKFTVGSSGQLTERKNVDFGMKSINNSLKILYNPKQDYLLDLIDKKLYSASNFTPIQSFEQPRFPSGINIDGNLILGSNNDPSQAFGEVPPEKKIRTYDLSSHMVSAYETKGYPHLLFENHLGQIVSISSGFKRYGLGDFPEQQDIFVEIIER